jgi:large subunit ribosomal protein L25
MELVKVVAIAREAAGKNQSKRLRATGQIPAVAYGGGKPALTLSVQPKDLVAVLARPLGRNSPIELEVEGKEKFTVLLCDYQYHPVSRELLHADFFKIHLDQTVDVDVPFELTGKAIGVVQGGVLRQVFRKLPVRCLPKDIPIKLSHDVTELDIDDVVHVSELALPAGVTIRLPADQTVAAVVTEKAPPEEELAPAPGAVPAAAGAAPAPGAPGAVPAAGAAPAEGKAEGKGGKGESKG